MTEGGSQTCTSWLPERGRMQRLPDAPVSPAFGLLNHNALSRDHTLENTHTLENLDNDDIILYKIIKLRMFSLYL